MQTPLQELIECIEKDMRMHDFSQLSAYEKAKELLEKEKQMVKDAFYYARNNAVYFDYYYNEKYNAELPPTTETNP
jgi:hypothetical protein